LKNLAIKEMLKEIGKETPSEATGRGSQAI